MPCVVSGLTSESTVVSSTTAPMSRQAYEYETWTQNHGPCVTTYMAHAVERLDVRVRPDQAEARAAQSRDQA